MQTKLSKFYMYLFLSFLAGIILVPLYLTFISSFKTLGDLSSNVIGLPDGKIEVYIQTNDSVHITNPNGEKINGIAIGKVRLF